MVGRPKPSRRLWAPVGLSFEGESSAAPPRNVSMLSAKKASTITEETVAVRCASASRRSAAVSPARTVEASVGGK